jgi:hypothetical protein
MPERDQRLLAGPARNFAGVAFIRPFDKLRIVRPLTEFLVSIGFVKTPSFFDAHSVRFPRQRAAIGGSQYVFTQRSSWFHAH